MNLDMSRTMVIFSMFLYASYRNRGRGGYSCLCAKNTSQSATAEVKPSQSVQPNTFNLSGGQNPSLLILSSFLGEKNETKFSQYCNEHSDTHHINSIWKF